MQQLEANIWEDSSVLGAALVVHKIPGPIGGAGFHLEGLTRLGNSVFCKSLYWPGPTCSGVSFSVAAPSLRNPFKPPPRKGSPHLTSCYSILCCDFIILFCCYYKTALSCMKLEWYRNLATRKTKVLEAWGKKQK